MKISKKITIAVLLVVVLASLLWYSPYLHENTENTLTLTNTTHLIQQLSITPDKR